jgi:hypothetical protein
MIVKRFARALRRQDWTSIAIEFLLVVLGVLLAFQISQWASEREARIEREAATERLLQEAEETVAYMRLGVATQGQLVEDLRYTLSQVQAGTWRSADQVRMTRAMQSIINAAAPSPPTSVYDDLVASGTFGKIGDLRMRSAVANYRGTVANNVRFVDYFRQRMPDFEDYEAFRYVYAPSKNRLMQLQVDFLGLSRDSRLQESLALVADGQLIMLRNRQRTLKDAAAMCVQLGRVVSRPCDLHRPIPNFN